MTKLNSPNRNVSLQKSLGVRCQSIIGSLLISCSISAASWLPQGPAPIINAGNVDGMVDPTNPQDGAVHVIAPHPTDANTIYIGTANGGIWRTTDGGKTWTPLTDTQSSLSIGGLAFDTEDKTYRTLVVGIGRWSNSAEEGGPRSGMLISTDAGATWTPIGTNTLNGFNLGAVAARGVVIMATANKGDGGAGGFFRSTDKGVTFTAGATGLPASGRYTALVGDPSDSRIFYTADLATGIYKSTDTGATWTSITGSITNFTGAPVNVVIAVGANGGSVFASIVGAGEKDQAVDVYNSRNQGATWVAIDPAAIRENNVLASPNNGGQGSVNSSLAADPTNPNLVYIAGDTHPDGGVSSGARAYSARMFRGDTSLATGSQWVHLTGNMTTNSSAPHADTRCMVFDSAGNLLEGDDGGIYKRTSPANINGGWLSINGNLVATEMHSIAYDRLTKTLLSGTQDNGSCAQNVAGALVWTEVAGGDGGKVAINNNTFTNFSIRYYSSQNLGGFAHSKIDPNNSSVDIAYPALIVGGTNLATYAVAKGDEFVDEESGDKISFAPPVVLNRIDQARIVIGNRSLYAGRDDLSGAMTDAILLTDLNGGTNNFESPINAIYWGHKDNPNLMLVGAGDALFVSTTSEPGSFVALPNYTGGTINDVLVHPGTANTFYVASGSTVWSSTDSGVTWSNIGAGLAALGTQQMRTLQFIGKNGSNAILAGGLGGFYALKLEAGATWFKVGDGMPNAIVWDSRYDEVDDTLIAGTLGRGAWTLPSASASVFFVAGAPVITEQPKPQTVVAGSTATFSVTVQSGSAVTYQWRKEGQDIPGATSSSLSLANVSNADEANYSVVAMNTVSSVTSEIVKLTVNPAAGAETPVLQIQLLSDHRVKITWQNGGRLQHTTALGGTWTDLSGAVGSIIETNSFENKFYRVVSP